MIKQISVVMLGLVTAASAFAAESTATVSPMKWQEGTSYFLVEPPQPTASGSKVEVLEVFSYACIHCAHFQPAVDAWLKKKPADVQWEYVPAVFGGQFTSFAAAYYAADAMGVRVRSHSAVFKAIFEEKSVKTAEPEAIADLCFNMPGS